MGRIMMLFSLAMMCLPVTAQATLVEAMEIVDMASRSTLVVRGIVESKSSVLSGGRIVTVYDVSVRRGWVDTDSLDNRIQVVLPGGQVDNIAQTAAGVPEFKRGAEVLLFLWRSPAEDHSGYRVLGMSMGSFRILREKGEWAESDRRGIIAVDQNRESRREGELLRLPLDSLESRIEKGMRNGFRRLDKKVLSP